MAGFEGKVRSFLPKEYQVPIAVYLGYSGLFGFYKMVSGHPKPKPVEAKQPEPTPVVSTGSNDFPSFDNFDKWIENDANQKRLEEVLSDDKKFEQTFGKQ